MWEEIKFFGLFFVKIDPEVVFLVFLLEVGLVPLDFGLNVS